MLEGDNFAKALECTVNVSYLRLTKPKKVAQIENTPAFGNIQSERGKQIDAGTLAKRWGIDHKKASNTVRMTTQRDVKTCLYPTLTGLRQMTEC